MDYSTLPQRKLKSKLRELFNKTGEELLSFGKELEEMKSIQKIKIQEEQSVRDIKENINLAEEALYETLISNVELDAVLALSSRGFELISIMPAKNSSSNLMFKKNGIDICLIISDHTRILLEESINA